MKGLKRLLPTAVSTFICCWSPAVGFAAEASSPMNTNAASTSPEVTSSGSPLSSPGKPAEEIGTPPSADRSSSSSKVEPARAPAGEVKAAPLPFAPLASAEVVHGALEDKRTQLRNKIAAAKKQGIGTSVYAAEFARIEDSVKQGADAPAIQKRVESLSSNLDEQMKRSQSLKTQRPVAPKSVETAHSGSGSNGSHGGSGDMDSMIKKLKERFGDQIPSNIDPETRDKFLHSDAAKELLKKYRGGD